MDLRKLRKFIKENKNLSFSENTTETQKEFVIEQKESKYKLKALLSENNTKLKVVLENAKNIVVEEYETTIENNDDMINKVKDAVALYDMIDDIDDNKEEEDNLDIDNDFRKTIPSSVEDENDQVNEDLLIDQPQDDQEVELVEKTKREKEGKEDHISDELGISESMKESKSNDFNKKFAIKTNGGYVKLINNNNSYQIVESADSATYSSDKEEMKSQLVRLAKLESRPLTAGKIVDLNEVKAEEEEKEQEMKENGIEVAGVQTAPISSNGTIGESLEIKIEDSEETNDLDGIEKASKLINDALKIIKDLQNKETDGTIKTILGSIDLNIQIPQGQIDELTNIMK